MTNEDVAYEFLKRNTASGSNLYSTGTQLFSYNTCIAQWEGGILIINTTKYSRTTSTHLGYIKYNVAQISTRPTVRDVPRGTSDLRNYVELEY